MKRNLSRPRIKRPTSHHRAVTTAVVLGVLAGGLGVHTSAASAGSLPQLCTAKPTFEPTIKAKYDQWGGSGGQLGCALTNAHFSEDGKAWVMDFRGGTITWRNQDIPPTVMLGAIRDKWYAIGGGTSRSPVGYSRTDSFLLFTPAGELGAATEFEQGSIYSAPSTGVHEVHGSINTYHRANFAALGFPTSDEEGFTEGGRMNSFQVGRAYWWSDTGVKYIPRNVVVGYMGLIADRETGDQGATDDETQVTVGAITPRSAVTKQTLLYEDIDSGDFRASVPVMELYRGQPEGITLTALAIEDDLGTPPQAVRDLVDAGVAAGAATLTGAIAATPGPGPVLAVPAAGLLMAAVPVISGAISSGISAIFGLGDDEIGRYNRDVSAKQMITYAAAPNQWDHGIKYKFQSEPLNKTGSYRLLFAVWKESA